MLQRRQFPFKPFSIKQLQVLSWWQDPATADNKALICDGSVRAGKTLIMSMSYVLWSMTKFNHQQFGIAGKTIGSLRRNVIRTLVTMLEGRGYNVKDSRTDNMLTITYGNTTNRYYLFGGKDESSQDLVQGLTAAGFFFDEVALMPESFVNQALARCNIEGSKYWFNCNPAGPFHWFKTGWVDQLEDKRALHIHFTMEDNPANSAQTLADYQRLYDGVFYQRYILGEWVLADGIVYDNFDKQTMVADAPEGIAKRYCISVDYGTQNPTVFLLWGLYDGVWWCLKEYYYDGRHSPKQKTDEQYADDFLKFMGNLKCTVIVDPSAASFIAVLRSRGVHVEKAKNDVLDGIRLTQTAMNTGKVMFTPRLTNLFKELASYAWDQKASERGEDKVIKQHDHACDAVRYFVVRALGINGKVKPKVKPKLFR
ncbi:PBSX family phage terminase large subunit [Levilactobacillus bambusae]|uniref:PBSX family phage terminase large subunit n=1 Tax=Levilactobacillus bambusae TaxID=2024736 RepID=A0A2V1N389_9LACO|nr:PBSX family phage terminase large subunit [Levilactobacillus bambusae]PWG00968.1 PBSX family phage terminase large subunit [Levilactobacillus bambusae]